MKVYDQILAATLVLFLTACGGSGGGGNPGPAIPTVPMVSLSGGQSNSLEPLADGAQWTYQCDSGAQPQITIKHFGQVSGADTFQANWPVAVGRTSSNGGSYVLANDGNGNLSYYGYVKAGTFYQVGSPLIEDATPKSGATYTIPDQNGGTVTTVFQNVVAVTTPAGSYGAAYLFHNTYSRSNDITLDFYDVKGIGTVRFDYKNGSQSDRCLLATTNVADSGK